jgi:hypothetical protein
VCGVLLADADANQGRPLWKPTGICDGDHIDSSVDGCRAAGAARFKMVSYDLSDLKEGDGEARRGAAPEVRRLRLSPPACKSHLLALDPALSLTPKTARQYGRVAGALTSEVRVGTENDLGPKASYRSESG